MRSDRIPTTWTLCVRSEFSYGSEQHYDMYNWIFLCQYRKNAGNSYCALATYELIGRVYLRSSLKIVKL